MGKNIFKELFESSPDACLIMNLSDGAKILDCNQAALNMLRAKDRKEIIGLTPDILSPEFQTDGRPSEEGAKENIEYTSKHGARRFEWMHKRLDGECFPADVSATVINYMGKPAFIVNWRDMTILREQENELEHQRKLSFEKCLKKAS